MTNVVSLGADPTGSKDSLAAFQAAANTGYVDIPDGIYLLSAPLALPPLQRFRGTGKGSVTMRPSFTAGNVLQVGGPGVNPSGLDMGGFAIVPLAQMTAGAAICIANGHDITLSDFALAGPLFNGVRLLGGAQQFIYKLVDFEINSCSNRGILVGDDGEVVQDITLTDGVVAGCGAGIELDACSGLYGRGVDVMTGAAGGWLFLPPAGAYVTGIKLSECLADTCGGTAGYILQGAVTDVDMAGCHASTCAGQGLYAGPGVNGLSWHGGRLLNNGANGLLAVQGSTNISVIGAHAFNNGTSAPGRCHGICFWGDINDYVVASNICGAGGRMASINAPNVQSFGIFCAGGVQNSAIISSNLCAGNMHGGVEFAPTGGSGNVVTGNSPQ